ncbi:MFS transporter [Lipingzhangella sp. LS1_29]|uniref:MFS transporter n=1 Tax=Lipingzhangella rawalii TaxID=2055835 RepID=A0ABU2H600_9ACTN|nr:MFS transporter [Lipingzhangella rawalii]MDS1270711.1 MFS transporter [Lipingzhangella rawalii]
MPLALLALAAGAFGVGTTEFVAMGILPDVAAGFGVSIPAAGYIISSYAVGVVVGAPLLTALGARLDRKILLLALLALFTLGNLATALAPTFEFLIAARVITALPHGTFFGVGAVVAAALVAPHRRAQAVSLVMAGLTVANIVGVPAGTWAAQALGWRTTFVFIALMGLVSLAVVALLVPRQPAQPGASAVQELGALRRGQVWLALLVGAVGFGGMFASYSYISPMLTEITGLAEAVVPVVLAIYGVGMTVGMLVGGWAADRALLPTIYGALTMIAVVLLALAALLTYPWFAVALVFLTGVAGSSLVPALQMRLMNTAHDAPSLAAALNHSALNFANALGAWLGGVVIAAGFGLTAPSLLGAGLAVLGLIVALYSGLVERRGVRPAQTAPPATSPAHLPA